ncbi:hypothetical protein SeLEV6574_g08249 [Synchytrium endobioticum]|nr:hypothetical protein SeLEV6574_g08249 [Synchytrium endobioticum]
MATQYSESERLIHDTAIKRLRALRVQLSIRKRSMKSNFARALNTVTTCRQNTFKMIHLHEKLVSTVPSIPPPSKAFHLKAINKIVMDPYLTERALRAQLATMEVSEREFQDTATNLWREAVDTEKTIVLELVSVIQQYQSTCTAQNGIMLELMKQALLPWNSNFDPIKEIHNFGVSMDIETERGVWNTPRTLDGFPYSPTSTAVLKSGVLFRQGHFRKSIWRPCWVVLTESGWLHSFEMKRPITSSAASPFALSLSRRASTSSIMPPSSLSSDVTSSQHDGSTEVPQSPRPVSTSFFQFHNEGGTSDGASVIDDYEAGVTSSLTKTLFSVSLKRPRVSVDFDRGYGSPFVFRVFVAASVVPTTSSSNSSISWAGWRHGINSSNEAGTKFILKAGTENEMILWIAAIRKVIEAAIPSRPPEPLFSSEDTIEARINDLVVAVAAE